MREAVCSARAEDRTKADLVGRDMSLVRTVMVPAWLPDVLVIGQRYFHHHSALPCGRPVYKEATVVWSYEHIPYKGHENRSGHRKSGRNIT